VSKADVKPDLMETVMARMDTRGLREQEPKPAQFRLVVALTVIAVAGIALTLAVGTRIPPEVTVLISP